MSDLDVAATALALFADPPAVRLAAPARRPLPAARPTDGGPIDDGAADDGPTLVARHLHTIDRAIGIVGARRRLSPTAIDDLTSDVYLRVLQRDAAILRSYRGESTLLAYLVVVVQRVLLDGHIARHGKWRPSAGARRLGRAAMLLERLVFADGLPLQEAAPLVRQRAVAPHTDDECQFLLSLLRPRVRRRMVDIAALPDVRADTPTPEALLLDRGRAADHADLARAIAGLDAADRELVRLRFEDGLRLREIARRSQIDERLIYRRFERVIARLRASLRVSGPTAYTPLRSRSRTRARR